MRYFYFEPAALGWEVFRAHRRKNDAWTPDETTLREIKAGRFIYEVAVVLLGQDGKPLTDSLGQPVSARVADGNDLDALKAALAIEQERPA